MTHEELSGLAAAGNWRLLWEQAVRLVDFALYKAQTAGYVEEVTDDMRQSVLLGAGAFVRTWDPLESTFSTYVVHCSLRQAKWAELRARSGLDLDEHHPIDRVADSALPVEELADLRTLRERIAVLPTEDQVIVSSAFGLDGQEIAPASTLAAGLGISRATYQRRLQDILATLRGPA